MDENATFNFVTNSSSFVAVTAGLCDFDLDLTGCSASVRLPEVAAGC
jgi:hypothetical protein